jgi:hypothetical protein
VKNPDNQRVDIEAMRRQLRQEFRGVAIELIEEKLNELILVEDGFGSPSGVPDDPEGDDDDDDDEKGVPPFVDVKFRNVNKIFTRPTESNYFGDILLSSDGTSNVNVVGRIFDDTPGIESYKIRIKRID